MRQKKITRWEKQCNESYIEGWKTALYYYTIHPQLSNEELIVVVNELETFPFHSMIHYRQGFEQSYRQSRIKSGNQLPERGKLMVDFKELGRLHRIRTEREKESAETMGEKVAQSGKLQRAKTAAEDTTAQISGAMDKKVYVNIVQITGRLGKDPEMTYIPSGVGIIKCSLAVWQPTGPTMWLELVMWYNDDETEPDKYNKPQADEFLNCHKGQSVRITGRMTMREYQGIKYFGINIKSVD